MQNQTDRENTTVYDVAIIGAGIIGCATAFELSKTKARVALLERFDDVAQGTTRANSGIVHAGYDPQPDTKMAQYNVEGNRLIRELAPQLNIPFRQTGSMVIALSPEQMPILGTLYDRGRQNGVPDLQLLTGEQARAKEPRLSPDVVGALYAPTGGIVNPWAFALAYANTAVLNGCDFLPRHEVTGIAREGDTFLLTTTNGRVRARRVVNAAGTHADEINNMIAAPFFHIRPNRGQYYLLDKAQGSTVNTVIFQCPTKLGKGVLVSPTVHGNLIVGPDAVDVDSPDDNSTTADGLAAIAPEARRSVPDVDLRQSIRNFAGVRADCGQTDFIVEESSESPGFFNLSGIKSPGLTSAPAIAADCVKMLETSGLHLTPRESFRLCPRPIPFHSLDTDGRAAMVARNPLYGRVICRCETITEGEILDAIHEPIPARTIDGVKRRCNAGMGRCQGGFCGPRVAAILAREWGVPLPGIEQDKPGSRLLTGWTKAVGKEEVI